MKIWKKLKSENVLPTQNQIPNQSDSEGQGDCLPWESFFVCKGEGAMGSLQFRILCSPLGPKVALYLTFTYCENIKSA